MDLTNRWAPYFPNGLSSFFQFLGKEGFAFVFIEKSTGTLTLSF